MTIIVANIIIISYKSNENSTFAIFYVGGVGGGKRLEEGFEALILAEAEAIFGQCFPADLMSAVKGMTIKSIDAYIQDPTASAVTQIYEKTGDEYQVVAEQAFTPTADSWNHITFDEAYTISGKEIIYAVKLIDLQTDKFHIGIDAGPATRGYGDLCNVGGSTWWSRADLGIDSNFCVRANVSGTPTAEISWISIDKNELSIAPGENDVVSLTLSRDNLLDGTYEGKIVLSTNDPLCPVKSIPVYMVCNDNSGINAAKTQCATVAVVGNELLVSADKSIAGVRVVSTMGATVARSLSTASSVTVALDTCNAGIYVVEIIYADGSHENIKVALKR